MLNFLNELVQLPLFGTICYQLLGYEKCNYEVRQLRAWSVGLDVQADLALYWW
jgi:hypothetical protein